MQVHRFQYISYRNRSTKFSTVIISYTFCGLQNPRLVSLEERPVLNGLTSFPESPRSSSGSNDIVQPRLARASSFGVPSYMETVEKEIIAALSELVYNGKKLTLDDVVDIEQILKHSEMTTRAFLQADRDQRSRLIQQELKKFRKGR
ncbi:hypothetical protein Hanom_Chr05g00432911 [Helianthus anomalus]